MAGPISKSIRSALRKAHKRVMKINRQFGSSVMTDEKGDMQRVVKHLSSAMKVLKLENYYY